MNFLHNCLSRLQHNNVWNQH